MSRILCISTGKALALLFALTTLVCLVPSRSMAQKRGGAEDDQPVFREYRGVQIGMTTEETRKKLGNPRDKGDEQDFYIFSDRETAQIVYDKAHKVAVMSVDFSSAGPDVPTPKTVVGLELDAKPDGSMYKMIRYAKAGYWVSYNRTAGDSPLITITIQKID